MKKIRIVLNTTNDAFSGLPEFEAARILSRLAEDLKNRGINTPCFLKDENGNKVGSVSIS